MRHLFTTKNIFIHLFIHTLLLLFKQKIQDDCIKEGLSVIFFILFGSFYHGYYTFFSPVTVWK